MKKVYRFVVGALLLIPTYIFGDEPKINYSDVENEVEKASKSGVKIVGFIIGVVLAIGLVNAIYQSVTGKHESRDKIVGWGVGLILYVIGFFIIYKLLP